MASSASSAEVNNMVCAVCTEVFVSPRFLPCHHTFCLPCLEQLVNTHGDVIPCPICRTPATVPSGGARNLQVNFYFTDEALERARCSTVCPVHADEHVVFHCTQCDHVICIRCKLTRLDGHATEDLSEVAARRKQTIAAALDDLSSRAQAIQRKHKRLQRHKDVLRQKRFEAVEEIQVRHDRITATVSQCRDGALAELNQLSDNLEQDLATDIQRAQDELNSLIQLQERARRALSTSRGTEVLQVDKDIRRRQAREKHESLSSLSTAFTYYPALRLDVSDNQDNIQKTIVDSVHKSIGTPVREVMPRCAIM